MASISVNARKGKRESVLIIVEKVRETQKERFRERKDEGEFKKEWKEEEEEELCGKGFRVTAGQLERTENKL